MKFFRATLDDCHLAGGLVVAIDVIRAFTTAAYAFAAGAREILPVSGVEEAFALRAALPGALLMGEQRGLQLPGFDFGNSPSQLAGQNLHGLQLVQRTSAGTQGLVRSVQASWLTAAAFCTARATAVWIKQIQPEKVTFVITGSRPDGYGDEDAACADYIQAVLEGAMPEPAPYIARVRASHSGLVLSDPARPEFPAVDLDFCTAVDRFDFVMVAERNNGLLAMKAINVLS